MKAKEVLKILNVSRVSLSTYIKKGWIKGIKLENGRFNYDKQSVYDFLNGKVDLNDYK